MRSININDARRLKSYLPSDNVRYTSYYGRISSAYITARPYESIKTGLIIRKNR